MERGSYGSKSRNANLHRDKPRSNKMADAGRLHRWSTSASRRPKHRIASGPYTEPLNGAEYYISLRSNCNINFYNSFTSQKQSGDNLWRQCCIRVGSALDNQTRFKLSMLSTMAFRPFMRTRPLSRRNVNGPKASLFLSCNPLFLP